MFIESLQVEPELYRLLRKLSYVIKYSFNLIMRKHMKINPFYLSLVSRQLLASDKDLAYCFFQLSMLMFFHHSMGDLNSTSIYGTMHLLFPFYGITRTVCLNLRQT